MPHQRLYQNYTQMKLQMKKIIFWKSDLKDFDYIQLLKILFDKNTFMLLIIMMKEKRLLLFGLHWNEMTN